MLLIKARAGPSKIHGLGLIAKEFIPKGTVMWKFKAGFDVEIPESLLPELSPNAQDQIEYYAYFHEELRTYVLSSDDDRFTNHSDDPNTAARHDVMIAIRDIAEGEEITSDYSQFAGLNFRDRVVPKLR